MLIWFMRWQELLKKYPKKILYLASNDHYASCMGINRNVSLW